MLRSTMMDYPLTLEMILNRGVSLYPNQEIVTGGATGSHRYTFAEFGARVRRMAGALLAMGIRPGPRRDVRLEYLPPPRAVLRRAADRRRAPHAQHPPLQRPDHAHR